MDNVRGRSWMTGLALVLMTSMAWAGIPPETEEEMEALANVVVDATVVEVTVVGVTEVPDELERVHFEATLAVNYDHLGGAPESLVIPFHWDFIAPQDFMSCGFTEPPHWVGEQAKYYLWGSGDGTYGLVSYDAMFESADSDPQAWTPEEIHAAAFNEDEPFEFVPWLPLEETLVPDPVSEEPVTGIESGCSMNRAAGGNYGLMAFVLVLLLAVRRRVQQL